MFVRVYCILSIKRDTFCFRPIAMKTIQSVTKLFSRTPIFWSIQVRMSFDFRFWYNSICHGSTSQVSPSTPSRSFLFFTGDVQNNVSKVQSVLEIFTKRSFSHLKATFEMYKSLVNKDIMSMIENLKTDDDFKYALQTVGTYTVVNMVFITSRF